MFVLLRCEFLVDSSLRELPQPKMDDRFKALPSGMSTPPLPSLTKIHQSLET